jgi:hypothetical protein
MSSQVEYIKVIADLIQTQMDLAPNRVYLYNQAWNIPPDDGLFVNVGLISKKPFGLSKTYQSVTEEMGGLLQVQMMNVQETYSVLIFSQNNTARIRNHEILYALNGDAAEQAQERYSFKIGYLPTSLMDVSEIDGASRLNRYNLTFNILCGYSQSRRVEYYSTIQDPFIYTQP